MDCLNLKPLKMFDDFVNVGSKGATNLNIKDLGVDINATKGFDEQYALFCELHGQIGNKRKNPEAKQKIDQKIHSLIKMGIPIHPKIASLCFNKKIGKPAVDEGTRRTRISLDARIRTIYKEAKILFKIKKLAEVDYYIGKCLNHDVTSKNPKYRQTDLYMETCSEIKILVEWLLNGWEDMPRGKLLLPRKETLNDAVLLLQLLFRSGNVAEARRYFINHLCQIDGGKNAVR